MKNVFDSIISNTEINNVVHYHIHPFNLYNFFAESKVSERRIPEYQRPYSWTEEHVRQLYGDILDLTMNPSLNKSWFLGPIFTTYEEGTPFSFLLDGQQRSTTIFLFLKEFTFLKFTFDIYQFQTQEEIQLRSDLENLISICERTITHVTQGQFTSRLKLESNSQDFFEQYVLFNPKNLQELNSKMGDLEILADSIKKKTGANSANSIINNRKVISDILNNDIINNADYLFPENLSLLKDLFNCLLFKCWFIEIPLKHDDFSILIFESINNRGKQLTLIDKLRFRTLILCKDTSKKQELKSLWTILFLNIDKLIQKKYIKNDGDFFKVLIISLMGRDFNDESSILREIENSFLENSDDVIQFLKDCIRVSDANLVLNTSLHDPNVFISKYDKKDQGKVRALFVLAEKMIQASAASRYLFYRNAYVNYDKSKGEYPFAMCLWNNIRLTVWTEIYSALPPNSTRESYIKQLSETNTVNDLLKKNFFQVHQLKYHLKNSPSTHLNLMKFNNSEKGRLLLAFYSFLSDFSYFTKKLNPIYLNYAEIEHLMPKKWRKNWSNSTFTNNDVLDFIDTLNQNKYPEIDLEKFKQSMLVLGSEIELNQSEKHDSNCILEFIGNKWLLLSGDNKRGQNKSFDAKKNLIFSNGDCIKLPSNNDPIAGFELYNAFTFKEIIERSLGISCKIIRDFHTPLF